MPYFLRDYGAMKKSSKEVLAENLAKLMHQAGQHALNQKEVGLRARCNQRTIGRVLNQEQAATVELLDGLAAAFGIQAWQLLVPDLDPQNLPVQSVTRRQMVSYNQLRSAALMIMDAAIEHKDDQ